MIKTSLSVRCVPIPPHRLHQYHAALRELIRPMPIESVTLTSQLLRGDFLKLVEALPNGFFDLDHQHHEQIWADVHHAVLTGERNLDKLVLIVNQKIAQYSGQS